MKEEKKTEGVCLSGSLTDASMIGMVVVSRDGRPFIERAAYHHPKTRGELSDSIASLAADFDQPSKGRFALATARGEVMLIRSAELGNDATANLEKLVRKRWADVEDRVLGMYSAGLAAPAAGGEDLVFYSLPKAELSAILEPFTKLPLKDFWLVPAPLLAARELGWEKSLADERVAILDFSAERTAIVVAHRGGVVAERGVEAGLDELFTAIQHKLELKFIGSAAKLFYDGIYDFSEVEDELVAGLGEKILPAVKELETAMGRPISRILPLNLAPETIWLERPLAKFFNRALATFSADSLAKANPDVGRLPEVVSMHVVLSALARGEEAWKGLLVPVEGATGVKPAVAALQAAAAASAKGKAAVVAAAPVAPAKAAPTSKPAEAAPAKAVNPPPAKAPSPTPAAAKDARSSAAKPDAVKAAPAKATSVPPPNSKPAPLEEKKKPVALFAGIAAVLVVAIVIFLFMRGGDELEAVKVAAAKPAAPAAMPGFAPAGSAANGAKVAKTPSKVEPDTSTVAAAASSGTQPTNPAATPEAVTAVTELATTAPEPEPVAEELAPEPEPEPEPTTGTMMVASSPEGAEVFLEGISVGRTPLEIPDLDAGEYAVRLVMPGYDANEFMLEVIAGEVTASELQSLRAEAADLRVDSGFAGVAFQLRKVGEESEDEAVSGVTPAVLTNLSLGDYEIVYNREGWSELSETVSLSRSQETVEAVLGFPMGSLMVTSAPSGAEVYYNGEMVGVTPYLVEGLPPGEAEISTVMPNFAQKTQTGTVVAGVETPLNFDLVDFDRIFIVSQVDREPRALTQVRPARMPVLLNVENVVVRCVIEKDGVPTQIEVLSSTNTRLNTPVTNAVAEWRFEPAVYMERPVKTLVTIPFVFRPEDR